MRIVAVGPGEADAVPAAALAALEGADVVHGYRLPGDVGALIGAPVVVLGEGDAPPAGAVVAAPDAAAQLLALAHPEAVTVPSRERLRSRAIGAEVAELARVGAHLRRECPWDREQTAATIVPHTIEEAFEVADAVAAGGVGLPDELGDLLFQSVFLSQLLEEEGVADLARVARGQVDKLISRHPHVYGDDAAASAGAVLDMWERRKREERADQGIFHELPVGLPALAYATKVCKRAGAVGFEFADVGAALVKLAEELDELHAEPGADELGDLLFAAVAVARSLRADPELALRSSAARFRRRVERAAALAGEAGERFEALDAADQLVWYARAHGEDGTDGGSR